MATYRLGLRFMGGDVEKGQLPGAMAQIYLKNWLQDDEGNILVSNDCMGSSELEGQVNRLKNELDEILRQGKKKFHEYRMKTVEAIDKKRHA